MRRAALAVVSGTLVAVLTPAAWLLQHRPPAAFGDAAAVAAAPAGPAAPPPSQDAGTPSPAPAVPSPVAPAPGPATVSARLADLHVPPADPPVQVRLDGVAAPVDAVGLDGSGGVAVPDDVRRAGWWRSGPQPGDPAGAAVLVGHVDSAEQGAGTFAVLRTVRAGDVVQVQRRSGQVLSYRVVARQELPKGAAVQQVFSGTGAPRLVLVSCGGSFDEATRSYRDNLVVTAVPLP